MLRAQQVLARSRNFPDRWPGRCGQAEGSYPRRTRGRSRRVACPAHGASPGRPRVPLPRTVSLRSSSFPLANIWYCQAQLFPCIAHVAADRADAYTEHGGDFPIVVTSREQDHYCLTCLGQGANTLPCRAEIFPSRYLLRYRVRAAQPFRQFGVDERRSTFADTDADDLQGFVRHHPEQPGALLSGRCEAAHERPVQRQPDARVLHRVLSVRASAENTERDPGAVFMRRTDQRLEVIIGTFRRYGRPPRSRVHDAGRSWNALDIAHSTAAAAASPLPAEFAAISNTEPSSRRSYNIAPQAATASIWTQCDAARVRSCQITLITLITCVATWVAATAVISNHVLTSVVRPSHFEWMFPHISEDVMVTENVQELTQRCAAGSRPAAHRVWHLVTRSACVLASVGSERPRPAAGRPSAARCARRPRRTRGRGRRRTARRSRRRRPSYRPAGRWTAPRTPIRLWPGRRGSAPWWSAG